MKKLILALLAAGTIVTANAQSQSILLYGNVGLSTDRSPALTTTTNWNASPGIGYQFNHNWTVGLALSWGQDATKDSTNTKYTVNMYKLGPFVRYTHYIGKSETFYWYTHLDFDYQGSYNTSGGNPAIDKESGVYVGLYPALGINVGRGLCLNFAVGGISYSTEKYTGATDGLANPAFTSGTYANNAFNFSFGQMVNVGISKNFNCGHKMHSHHEPAGDGVNRKGDRMEDDDDAAPKPKKKQRDRDDDE